MNTVFKASITSILATILFAIVLCGFYPVLIWGVGQLLFPRQANGSVIESRERTIVGSELLGQNFSGAKYFHPRPSAAGANGYDPANSSGSDPGPHRVGPDVQGGNERALGLYRREGFGEEGRLRESVRSGDGFDSLIVMSLLEHEHHALVESRESPAAARA